VILWGMGEERGMSLFTERRKNEPELTVSGLQVLLILALVITSAAPLMWILVRNWILAL
jgi:hypothetical protein